MDEYFKVLGLSPGASPEEIRQAYKDLVNVWHPDRFTHDPRLQQKAQEELKKINDAFEKLHPNDPEKAQPPPVAPKYATERTGPHKTTPAPSKHTDLRLAGGIFIAFVIAFALYRNVITKPDAPATPAPPLPQFHVAEGSVPSEPEHKELAPTPTPEEILARKRKEAERWGAATFAPDKTGPESTAPPPHPAKISGYFTVGSTKEDVLAIQGTPDTSSTNLLKYGESNVYFEEGKVSGWENHSPRLKVKLKPTTHTSGSTFTVGSSKDQVLSVEGTPDSFSESEFMYGESSVHFENGRVTSWFSRNPPLKVRMQPR